MTSRVTSKNGIIFLTPLELGSAIQHIERHCPGWVWSLSQTPDHIRLSMSPGRKGPHPNDGVLALTSEGDRGYHFTYPGPSLVHDKETIVTDFIDTSIISLNEKRGFTGATELVSLQLPEEPVYRRQSRIDILNLITSYKAFLDEVSLVEHHGYFLTEIYVGSCDFSADCSLRGDKPDGSKFDVSVDLTEEGTISESVSWALQELKSDILTPR